MSHEKNPGWLGYIGDYTTQFFWDYNKPLKGFLLTNQYIYTVYIVESRMIFFVAPMTSD